MITYEVKVYNDGTKVWYLNGKRHREDGPAIESSSGTKEWFINGKRHREDGPAIEYYKGYKKWFLNDKELTEGEYVEQVNTCNNKIVMIDGVENELKRKV